MAEVPRPEKRITHVAAGAAMLVFCCSSDSLADPSQWQFEIYGGKYYGSDRAALYGALSHSVTEAVSITVEALHEKIDDYQFRGIGAHFLWQIRQGYKLGVVGSKGSEYYAIDMFSGDQKTGSDNVRYDLTTAALEAELNFSSFTVAAQAGRIYVPDYDTEKQDYTSIDAYYWGDADWYIRAADQRTGDDAVTFAEGYRSWGAKGLTGTFYVGASAGEYDSAYAGTYIELTSDDKSSWTLDMGGGMIDGEWQLQLELYIFLGPGADTPYISAFGFTVGD